MKLLDIIESTEKDVIIIASNEQKNTILKSMHQAGMIQPVSFMSKQDLFEKVFFKYSIDALYEASSFLGLSLSITKAWLEYLPFIDENKTYENAKLDQLKTLKKHLLNNGNIQKNIFSDVWIRNKLVIVYTPYYDVFLKSAIQKIEAFHDDLIYYDSRSEKVSNISFKRYKTIEDEITDVAIQIQTLHQQGHAYDSMVIMNIDKTYHPIMKRIFNWFHIPLNLNESVPLVSLALTQRFLKAFDQSECSGFESALKEALTHIKPFIDSKESAQVYQSLIRVLNPMVRYIKDKHSALDLIEYTIKHTTLPNSKYLNAVEVSSDIKAVKDDEHLFLMALKEGNAPSITLDDDFLNKNEKQMIDYPKASEINQASKARYEDALFYSKNVYASFSESSFSESFRLSTFINELLNSKAIQIKNIDVYQPFSETYDYVQSKIEKDYYDLYQINQPFYQAFANQYQASFNTYDNTFDQLSKRTMKQLLKIKPSFSVTQIEDYFKCGLTFLLKHFLKITPSDSPFYRHLGTFFHEVLENHISKKHLDESDLRRILNDVLKDEMHHYTNKDLYFFEKPFPFLLKAHEMINMQEKTTKYNVAHRELSIQKPYTYEGVTLHFKGKIDKVLTRNESALLIDYKTGSKTLDLLFSPLGLNSQLVFYALLYQHNYPTHHVDGFYEQTILPSKIKAKRNETFDTLVKQYYKLRGYTLNDESIVLSIDPSVDKESEILSDVKFTKNGAFDKRSKTFEKEDLNAVIDHLETLLNQTTKSIINGKFPIDPKRINHKDVSCEYCPFIDICYKEEKDYQSYTTYKDPLELFSALKEGVDHER